MDHQKTEKLKKLLRLSRNHAATPSESAAAMRKAIALASACGLDIDAIDTSEPNATPPSMHHLTRKFKRSTYEDEKSANLAAKQFGVETVWATTYSGKALYFIGPMAHVEVAAYCQEYMAKSARRAWTKRTNRRLRDRRSFIQGFFLSLKENIGGEFRERSLAYQEAIQAEIDSIFGPGKVSQVPIKNPKRPNIKALTGGFISGKSAGIRNALNA